MINSILTSVKKVLGIEEDYEVFDQDIIMHINTTFAVLTQLGVGPQEGFMIEDKEREWSDFIGDDPRLNMVRTYVYEKVRLLFDPPTSSFALQALQDSAKELEWRLNIEVDPRDLDQMEC